MLTKQEIVRSKYFRYLHYYNLFKNENINELDLRILTGLTPEEINLYLSEIENNNILKKKG